MDVRRYFPSIDHELLKAKLRRRIKDQPVLNLLDRIIDGSPPGEAEPSYFHGDNLFTPGERRVSIPIGNLTSQFFANLYLDDLDHYIKQVLNVRAYLRYVDDMAVLDHDKARLADIRAAPCASHGPCSGGLHTQDTARSPLAGVHKRGAHYSSRRGPRNATAQFRYEPS
jgi:hypothetical protein